MLRKAILAAAESPRLQRVVRRHGMRLGAARFVAGETLDEAVQVLRGLNEKGLRANTTLLGEGVSTEAETRAVVAAYTAIFDRIAAEQLRVNVALKLTHLGLAFDEELALANIGELVGARGPAARTSCGSTWRSRPTWTRRCVSTGPSARRGTRTSARCCSRTSTARPAISRRLLDLQPNLRFVKGAYLEPPTVAFPEKPDVDAAYRRLIERSLAAGGFTAIATHDEALLAHAIAFAQDNDVPRTRFQFQMLYGVRAKLQLDLVRQGYDVLVATPYGPDWYRYLMRRLAERPANVLFIARNLVRR